MTENLLKNLEDKIMRCLSEIEELRDKVAQLSEENLTLKMDHDNYESKFETRIREMIMLFDTIIYKEPLSATGTTDARITRAMILES